MAHRFLIDDSTNCKHRHSRNHSNTKHVATAYKYLDDVGVARFQSFSHMHTTNTPQPSFLLPHPSPLSLKSCSHTTFLLNPSTIHFFPYKPSAHPPLQRRHRPITMTWIERKAKIGVESDANLCYSMYSDLNAMPKFSPWVKSIEVVQKGKDANGTGSISLWTLGAKGFQFQWRSRITTAKPNSMIAWESVSGLSNKGHVSFVEKTDGKTDVCLTLKFSVPRMVGGFLGSSFIGRFVQKSMMGDMRRFREMVLEEKRRRALEAPKTGETMA